MKEFYLELELEGERSLEFYVEALIPTLPLIAYGEIWHTGWDIATRWAIDADKNCWKDGAHGGALHPCSAQQLISETENENQQNRFRRLLGLLEEEPSWMAAARAAGWTPPQK